MKKVVVVTGANSGIGLALCERLLAQDDGIRLCLACRNPQRAEAARSALLTSHPSADVTTLQVDVGRLQSVMDGARALRERYDRIDYLYLNAGIMPNPSISLKAFIRGLFSRNVVRMFATGEGLLTQEDRVTADGLQEVFETNVFGHFILVTPLSCHSTVLRRDPPPCCFGTLLRSVQCLVWVPTDHIHITCPADPLFIEQKEIRELESVLCRTDRPAQLIWTSSSNARKSAFCLSDYQHSGGRESYSASKYATDLLSVALNRKYNAQGLHSSVVCPGLVMTNLTYGILPSFFWKLILPIMWLIRVFTNSFTISPYNGAEALLWLFNQRPESLDPRVKYHSCTSALGTSHVRPVKMDLDEEISRLFYNKLLDLETHVRSNVIPGK